MEFKPRTTAECNDIYAGADYLRTFLGRYNIEVSSDDESSYSVYDEEEDEYRFLNAEEDTLKGFLPTEIYEMVLIHKKIMDKYYLPSMRAHNSMSHTD